MGLEKQGYKQVIKNLKSISKRFKNQKPAWNNIGKTMLVSIQEDFNKEGDPAWIPSKRVLKWGGKTLTKSGKLRRSIKKKSFKNRVELFVKLPYAAIHQYGYAFKHIPKREFITVHPKNLNTVLSILNKYIISGK